MRASIDGDCAVVRINAPEWYQRADFVASLEDDAHPAATWHRKASGVGEYSDLFMTYDAGEGDHADFLPPDIWSAISAEMERLGVSYAVVWVTNLAEDEPESAESALSALAAAASDPSASAGVREWDGSASV